MGGLPDEDILLYHQTLLTPLNTFIQKSMKISVALTLADIGVVFPRYSLTR